MTSLVIPNSPSPARDIAIGGGAAAVTALIVSAVARRAIEGGIGAIAIHNVWLAIHLATVVPALPLGGYLFLRRKGHRRHKLLGRLWGVLMMVGAASSFGLMGLMGHLSPIHLLAVLVLVSVPRAVMAIRRGDVAKHQRIMTTMFASLIVAGLFTFLPGRLLGQWLFG